MVILVNLESRELLDPWYCICILTIKVPISTYKFSRLISIHFLKKLVERI